MAGGAAGPRVLVVATKCPWPSIDGGRLVLAETLRALADAGAEITLVSPAPAGLPESAAASVDPLAAGSGQHPLASTGVDASRQFFVTQRPTSWTLTLLRPWTPATIVRQTRSSAIEAVARLVAERGFDAAHAEQLQALPMLEPARKRGIPIVLRAQNVESDLWAGAARALPLAAPWLLLQAALLRRWEGSAVARVAVTVALTVADAARLRALARGSAKVVHVAAPFPRSLPAAGPLPGSPAVVLAGGGWIPNRDGARWFLRRVWPLVLARLPAAHLHVFDAGAERLPRSSTAHPAPGDSIDLFPANAIHFVPLRVASGVRMKVLEAWARGVPVVATTTAAAGLEAGADAALLQEAAPAELAVTVETLAHDPDLRERLVSEGRRLLAVRHDPKAIAARWLELYREAAGWQGAEWRR
jgi:hypothetical protein